MLFFHVPIITTPILQILSHQSNMPVSSSPPMQSTPFQNYWAQYKCRAHSFFLPNFWGIASLHVTQRRLVCFNTPPYPKTVQGCGSPPPLCRI